MAETMLYGQHVHNRRSSFRTLEAMKHWYFPQTPINTNLSSSTRSTTRASPTNANSESIPAQTPRLVTQPEHGCQCPLSQTHCKKPQKPPSSYAEGIWLFQKRIPCFKTQHFHQESHTSPPTMLDQFSRNGALPRDASCPAAGFPANIERDMDLLLSLLG